MVTEQIITKSDQKQTYVERIPKDWKIVQVGDHFNFKNGLNKAKKFFGQGTPIINYMNVYPYPEIYEKYIQGKVTLTNGELRTFDIRKGDVLFTRTSETLNEIGLSSVVLDDVKKTVFSGFLLRARPTTDLFGLEFKKYCFRSKNVRRQIISTSSKTTRALTNGKLLSKVSVLIPINQYEQLAISESISDIEKCIKQLDYLIEKKKNIKQGVMQELLTGGERLFGFIDEWETKELGKIVDIKKGQQLNKSNLTLKGSYPVWNGGIEPSGFTHMCNELENTITISEGGNSCGFVNFSFEKFWCGGHCYALNKPKLELSKTFLYYVLKMHEKSIMKLRVGSGLPNIQKKRITEFPIGLPPFQEQIAIAEILSDIDSEIKEFETKKDKYMMIKNGMIQKLLTGEIRLT